MKKPELLATAADMDELRKVIKAGADAVNIGGTKYGLRMAGKFSIEEMKQAVEFAHQNDAKIYVSVNSLMHNEDLEDLPDYLQALATTGLDAIVYSDPAVLMTAREQTPEIPLHWSTEITSTNYQTINYWVSKGSVRADLARELNMDEIIEVKEHVNAEIQVQVHGVMCMFHSKRDLVTNYMQFKEENSQNKSKERQLFIKEEKRDDQKYPIYEDEFGTHIMSAEDICMIDYLPELIDGGIDSLKIEGIMKLQAYNEKVVGLYRQAIDLYLEDSQAYEDKASQWRKEIESIQPPGRIMTTGFFFKEQIF